VALTADTVVPGSLEDRIIFDNSTELPLVDLRRRARAMGGRFPLRASKSEYLVSNDPSLLEEDDILLSQGTSGEVLLKISCDYDRKVGTLEVLRANRPIMVRETIVRNTAQLVDGDIIRIDTGQILRCDFTEGIIEEERNIIRDASGHPSGVLLEAAMAVMERALANQFSQEEKLALLRDASQHLSRYGVTSVVNATGKLAEIQLYAALRDRGQLTVRTRTSFGAVAVNHHLTPEFLADLEKARTLYHDDWVSANLVKFFVDGGTGLIPPLTYEPAEYKKLVLELDKRGYQIMTHTYRPDSSRLVVDTYEEVEKINGPRDRRLRLEHADFVPAQDIPRMAKLSLIASMQPTFCCDENGSNYDPRDRTTTDRWQSMEKSGVKLAFGSDWPCTWPPNPLVAIQAAVTRTIWRPAKGGNDFPGGVFDGAGQGGTVPTKDVYVPEERLTVEQAVNAYTQGSAYARFSDDRTGTLEAGKEADLAVLSRDIFSAKPEEIAKARVVITMVGGRVVFTEGN